MSNKEEHTSGKRSVTKLLRKPAVLIAIAVILLIIVVLVIFSAASPHEKATASQADDITRLLAEQNVTIQSISVANNGYEITYAAESAADRFDDALLYDWATIYAVAAVHQCDTVSIITTLDNQSVERQSASCEAVRALARGVISEKEFWMLVKHQTS